MRKFTFLPSRTTIPGLAPLPGSLGDGQPGINIPDRRMWIGCNGEVVEVKDLQHLIDCWLKVIEQANETAREYEANKPLTRMLRLVHRND